MPADYYDLLGVARTASADEIKKAFRTKAHQYHPDKASGDAEQFKKINEAYQVLSDAEKRKQYDQFGQTYDQARRQGGAPGGDPFGGFAGGQVDFGDLGDMFGDLFGFGGGRAQRQPQRGRDVQATLRISWDTVIHGSEESIQLKRLVRCDRCEATGAEPGTKPETCTTCQGSGQVRQVQRTILGAMQSVQVCPACQGEGTRVVTRCTTCQGEGRVQRTETMTVKIPAGIGQGQKIRLSGKGEAGRRGTASGDLYIEIDIADQGRWQRDGDDVILSQDIPLTTAVLGGMVHFKTVDEEVTLKIPAGSRSGKEFILRGKGIPHLRGRGRGDARVIIQVEIPDKISAKAKKLLKELEGEGL